MTEWTISVEEDLTPEQAETLLNALEEVLGRNSLSLNDSGWEGI